jgi:hypothetical protein
LTNFNVQISIRDFVEYRQDAKIPIY